MTSKLDDWYNGIKAEMSTAFGERGMSSNLTEVRAFYDNLVKKYNLRMPITPEIYLKIDYFPEVTKDKWTLGMSLFVSKDFKASNSVYMGRVDFDKSTTSKIRVILSKTTHMDIFLGVE